MPRLAGVLMSASTNYIIYSAPTASRATVTINLCNQNTFPAFIQVALINSGSGSPSLQDYIEFNTTLAAGATLERTGITPYNSESIYARSSVSNVSVVVWGYTE